MWTQAAIQREISEANATARMMAKRRMTNRHDPAREPIRGFVARSAPRPQRDTENPAAKWLRSIASWRAIGLIDPGTFTGETVAGTLVDRPATHSLLRIASENGKLHAVLGWRGTPLYDALAPAPRDCGRAYSTTIHDGVGTVVLHDNIGEAFDGVPVDRILSDLARVEKAGCDRLELDIFSGGGCARGALEVYDALRALPCQITARITGVAASGAAIIASAAHEVLMHRDAFFMIHATSMEDTARDDDEYERAVRELAELDEATLAIYVARTGLDENDVSEMMAVETWMAAIDALRYGYIDGFTDGSSHEPIFVPRFCEGAQGY